MGKEDTAQLGRERPEATVREVIDTIIETGIASGVGVTKVTIPDDALNDGPILVEIHNPSVRARGGAGKALLLSYWCGALSFLFDSEFEIKDVAFNEAQNVLAARIVRRVVK